MTESSPAAPRRPLPPLGWKGKLGLLIFGTLLALAGAELALRIVGYAPGISFYERDATYGWRNRPSFTGITHGPVVRINAFGCRGPEFEPVKPAGTLRIIALGCSCTIADNVGETETFEYRLQEDLAARARPGVRVEVINAGVGGYSTHMGRKWLAKMLEYQPDVVILYFGWNDHWPQRAGGTDRQLDGSVNEQLKYYALKLKLAQFLYQVRSTERMVRLESAVRGWFSAPPPATPAPAADPAAAPASAGGDVTLGYRVPLDEYGENLQAMVAAARAGNARVVLIAAPLQYPILERHRGLTAATVPFIDPTDPDKVAANHHLYTEMVRRVGAECAVPVADLEREFNRLAQPERDRLFYDFVHPNAAGFAAFGPELSRAVAVALAPDRIGQFFDPRAFEPSAP